MGVPLLPLAAEIRAGGGEALTLTASIEGGIDPYTVTWDLDGDLTCDDHTGVTVPADKLAPSIAEAGTHRVKACVTDSATPAGAVEARFEARTLEGKTTTAGPTGWALGGAGLLAGALIVYGLSQAGVLRTGGSRGAGAAAGAGDRPSIAAEGKDMLELRQRVMVAALKELEIAKKKGEVAETLYTPLKAELKQDTVRVMRELEKRKGETI